MWSEADGSPALSGPEVPFFVRPVTRAITAQVDKAFIGPNTRSSLEFLDGQTMVNALHADLLGFLGRWLPCLQASDRNYVTVAIGCTGGQHRSVYMVERLAADLGDSLGELQIRHRELNRKGITA